MERMKNLGFSDIPMSGLSDLQKKMRRTSLRLNNFNFQVKIFNFWQDVFITLRGVTLRSVMEILAFVSGFMDSGLRKKTMLL